MKIIHIFFILLITYALSAAANNIELLKQKAKNGDPIAQYNLGYMYLNASDVIKDNAEGMRWMYESAKQNNAEAEYLSLIHI